MKIAEIFHSIQGEGRLAGTPSVFVRSTGCNLRCGWCDTPYTSWRPEGREWTLPEIVARVRSYACRHVVITGGEPLLAPDLQPLTTELQREGFHITVETAGTLFREMACHLLSISPKLSNSIPYRRMGGRFAEMHDARRLNPGVIRRLADAHDYQLKFVMDRPSDIDEVLALLEKIDPVECSRVLLMAQARSRRGLREKSGWIAALCRQHGFGYSPRLQIELFGNRRGT